MKLKSDIRIKILNDRYRPIDLYVFKKKQTNKQKQKTKKSCKCQNQWLKREINPSTNKETNKNKKTKQNKNIKKGLKWRSIKRDKNELKNHRSIRDVSLVKLINKINRN